MHAAAAQTPRSSLWSMHPLKQCFRTYSIGEHADGMGKPVHTLPSQWAGRWIQEVKKKFDLSNTAYVAEMVLPFGQCKILENFSNTSSQPPWEMATVQIIDNPRLTPGREVESQYWVTHKRDSYTSTGQLQSYYGYQGNVGKALASTTQTHNPQQCASQARDVGHPPPSCQCKPIASSKPQRELPWPKHTTADLYLAYTISLLLFKPLTSCQILMYHCLWQGQFLHGFVSFPDGRWVWNANVDLAYHWLFYFTFRLIYMTSASDTNCPSVATDWATKNMFLSSIKW